MIKKKKILTGVLEKKFPNKDENKDEICNIGEIYTIYDYENEDDIDNLNKNIEELYGLNEEDLKVSFENIKNIGDSNIDSQK